MGIWGTGPFASDNAQDLVDELSEMSESEKRDEVFRILSTATERPHLLSKKVFVFEVVAVAALVALSLPQSHYTIADQYDDEEEQERFASAIVADPDPDLALLALSALNVVAGPGGPWLQGWKTASDAVAAEQDLAAVRTALQTRNWIAETSTPRTATPAR